ncbi:chromosome segregation protein SMC [uncultured Bartonella sp.]|uniref:chromosome segregation protein SMC n=1 Tax=uncultured Bartonella sp. TaxID=104108 RepID=UPI00261C2786|nr:chromosome segregation protein SMC [uncultured Bartonella sp.]
MQFTKLRLVGFKSFVEAQELVIERGLTGIVGPNGCGKSNLVEALRWVMGENSYKNMRASGMDDVIFSGSATRPPRNFAEVTLFLDNLDRSAPATFNEADELQVSRRIERDSGSLYRINGKDVRAKDVQLLFADQSTGARSPSMVGQGRIGELIQAKPQARRALLEEAAGISGLYSRRHEAELRLRAAEGNLDRLEDVVGDLASRIESLKRQTRQANRFKSLSADIRQAEAGLFYLRWSESKTQEAEALSALNSATMLVAEKAQAHMRAEKAQENSKNTLPPLREEAAKASAAYQRLNIELKQLDEEEKRNRQRQSELLLRLEQLATDIAREEQLVVEDRQSLARLDEEEGILTAEAEEQAQTETELQVHLDELQAILDESEGQSQALTQELAKAKADEERIGKQISDVIKRSERLHQNLAEVTGQIDSLRTKLQLSGELQEATARLQTAETLLAESEEIQQQSETAIEAAREAENALRPHVGNCRDELNGLVTEARTLDQLLGSFIQDKFSPVVDQISVRAGYEIALGAALGDDLEGSLEEGAPLFWSGKRSSCDISALPEGVQSLSHFVTAPQALHDALCQIGVVDDKDGGKLQQRLAVGQKLVSPKGALWRWDGLQAREDAPTAAAQRLAQKNRLNELSHLIEHAREALNNAEADLRKRQKAVEEAQSYERDCRTKLRSNRENRDKAQQYFSEIERHTNEHRLRLAALEENARHYQDEFDEAKKIHLIGENEQKKLPDITALEAKVSAFSLKLSSRRAEVSEALARLQNWKHNASARRRRLENIGAERKNWVKRIENAGHQIEALVARRKEAMLEAEQLAEIPEGMEERRQNLLDALLQKEAEGQKLMDRLAQAENVQTMLDKQTSEAFAKLSSSREERARAEERLNAAVERRQDIEARIAEALNCPPHETLRLAQLTVGKKLPDVETLEHQLERLRIERERLGAVNLRADEEEKELRTRFDAITGERDDVVEAIKKLRLAIQNLNHEGRERLISAFTKVNFEFQRLYHHLFGGGTAELQLVESDDPLDAGVEILARPPGKKPQTMTLLSGGEQALTAMALIFAVFLTSPAPICVLDEVDAPLDDHNVERYCNLMDEMSKSTKTRFIVITHNPITMARMDRLFGVTMGEQGVSQLVSVDLQTAEKMRDIG